MDPNSLNIRRTSVEQKKKLDFKMEIPTNKELLHSIKKNEKMNKVVNCFEINWMLHEMCSKTKTHI